MILLIEYIIYRLKAKNRHGIHSPFVYDFINKCLTTKIDKKFLYTRKKLFKKIKNNSTSIKTNDFGAGSKKLKSFRKISSIFNTSSSKGKFSILLFKISNFYKPNTILELGTSLGIGSFHLSNGNQTSKLTTIEACSNTAEIAIQNFEFTNTQNIKTIISTFENFFENEPQEIYDLIFIDGHHNGNALMAYLEKLKKYSHNDTIFILDDIRWSSSMKNAWQEIVKDEYFNLTIDLFRMGIIIPRKQQQKEHFVIKF